MPHICNICTFFQVSKHCLFGCPTFFWNQRLEKEESDKALQIAAAHKQEEMRKKQEVEEARKKQEIEALKKKQEIEASIPRVRKGYI